MGSMLERQAEISDLLARLRSAHPAGFSVALHMTFAAPRYLFQSFERAWIDLYSQRGMVLRDPTVRWALGNTGAIRWSALPDPAGQEVMRLAAAHGMRFGFTEAIVSAGSRSFVNCANARREATEAEIAAAGRVLAALHRLTIGLEALTPRFHDALKAMSIFLTRG